MARDRKDGTTGLQTCTLHLLHHRVPLEMQRLAARVRLDAPDPVRLCGVHPVHELLEGGPEGAADGGNRFLLGDPRVLGAVLIIGRGREEFCNKVIGGLAHDLLEHVRQCVKVLLSKACGRNV